MSFFSDLSNGTLANIGRPQQEFKGSCVCCLERQMSVVTMVLLGRGVHGFDTSRHLHIPVQRVNWLVASDRGVVSYQHVCYKCSTYKVIIS